MSFLVKNISDQNLVFKGGYLNILIGQTIQALASDVNAGVFKDFVSKGYLEVTQIESGVSGFVHKVEEAVKEEVEKVETFVKEEVAKVKKALGISKATVAPEPDPVVDPSPVPAVDPTPAPVPAVTSDKPA